MATRGIGWGDVDTRQVERQRALAEQLIAKQGKPAQGQMVGNHYVPPHWTQQLADGLSGIVGRKLAEKADTRESELAQQRRTQLAEALDGFGKTMAGTPAQEVAPLTPNDDDGNVNPSVQLPAKAGDPRAAYAQLLASGLPELQQIGTQGLAQLPQLEAQQVERRENRDWRTNEAEAQRAARTEQLQMAHQQRMDAMAAQNATREQMMQEQQRFQQQMQQERIEATKALKSLGGGGGQQPYFQPVQTAQGVAAFNARTGKLELIAGPNGAPIIGAQADPALQGAITGAKEGAKAEVERGTEVRKDAKRSDQLLSNITEAEKLLDAGPTASTIGSYADAAMRGVGMSTEAAQKASQLETLGGWMTANVPRMEGPQSNIDVQNYQIMAGKVGDRTAPVAERKAALKTLRTMQEKYKHLNQGATPAAPAAAPKRIRLDAQGNVIP